MELEEKKNFVNKKFKYLRIHFNIFMKKREKTAEKSKGQGINKINTYFQSKFDYFKRPIKKQKKSNFCIFSCFLFMISMLLKYFHKK